MQDDLFDAMIKNWVTKERIIARLKEGIETSYTKDKNWNLIPDWSSRARMLDMIAKMNWMYKAENEQTRAVQNVANIFSNPKSIF
jgi:hypothetical protein